MKKVGKKHLIATSIYIITFISIAGFAAKKYMKEAVTVVPPPLNPIEKPMVDTKSQSVEAVFVLDTTGSMSGLINAAKQKIWSIASTLSSAQQTPNVKIGLVAYRDRGDSYVTQVHNLTDDLDEMYSKLMAFQADGGGDHPESVNKGLSDAINKITWSKNKNVYKVVFLVGDAPPHMDYPQETQYPEIIKQANKKEIRVNTIQCGQDGSTTSFWRKIAGLSQGKYFRVNQNGGAMVASTPFDEKIAKLSDDLDKTRMIYGKKEARIKSKKKFELSKRFSDKATTMAKAARGHFNSLGAGKKNFLGDQELVEDVSSGKTDLSAVEEESLPEALQGKTLTEKTHFIANKSKERERITKEIQELSKKRQDYLKNIAKNEGKSKNSFDAHVYSAIKEQAAMKGLDYNSGPVY